MAFKLAKASGSRVPDMVDDLVADATSLPITAIENGILVTIATDGELEQAAPGDKVAGILVNDAGESRYAAPSGETYTSTFINTDKTTFIPVTGTVLIEADVSGLDAQILPGRTLDFEATGWTVVGAAFVAQTDFYVVRVKYADDGTTVLKAYGFFLQPGYFVS